MPDFADLQYRGLKSNHRPHGIFSGRRRRVAAVEGIAGPAEIEAVVAAEEQAGRVGEAGARSGKARPDPGEGDLLPAIEGMFGFVGAGQMAHQDRAGQGVDRVGIERLQVSGIEAKPRHAGVDMQCCLPRHGPAAKGKPVLYLVRVVEAGRQTVPGERLCRTRQQPVQHKNFGRRHGLPQRHAFLDIGNEKGRAAFGGQAPGRRYGAEPISVGLDHGGTGPALHPVPQLPPVGGKRVQIDGEQSRAPGVLQSDFRFSAPRHGRIVRGR